MTEKQQFEGDDPAHALPTRFEPYEAGTTSSSAARQRPSADAARPPMSYWRDATGRSGKLRPRAAAPGARRAALPVGSARPAGAVLVRPLSAQPAGRRRWGALRFRRLLDCRDRDDLDHRLRGMLKLASQTARRSTGASSARTSSGSSPRATRFVVAGRRTSMHRWFEKRLPRRRSRPLASATAPNA